MDPFFSAFPGMPLAEAPEGNRSWPDSEPLAFTAPFDLQEGEPVASPFFFSNEQAPAAPASVVPPVLPFQLPFLAYNYPQSGQPDLMAVDESTALSPRSSGSPRDQADVMVQDEAPVSAPSLQPHVITAIKLEWVEDEHEDEELRGSVGFICPLSSCQRLYRRKGDLKVHVKKKHSDCADLPDLISRPRSSRLGKPYPCPVLGCPCGFLRARGLQRHCRKKHPALALSSSIIDDEEEGSSSTAAKPLKYDSDSYSD